MNIQRGHEYLLVNVYRKRWKFTIFWGKSTNLLLPWLQVRKLLDSQRVLRRVPRLVSTEIWDIWLLQSSVRTPKLAGWEIAKTGEGSVIYSDEMVI